MALGELSFYPTTVKTDSPATCGVDVLPQSPTNRGFVDVIDC